MLKYVDLIPEQIYSAQLKIIQNIKFTPREIDVIACLLQGKSIKGIANFLSDDHFLLQPRTIETHIHNIKKKIGGNGKDSIINFIEISDKYQIIREYYLSLLIQKEFLKTIRELSLIKEHIKSLCIIYIEDEKNFLLVKYIEKYFKPYIPNVIKKAKQNSDIITNLSFYKKDKQFVICLLGQKNLETSTQVCKNNDNDYCIENVSKIHDNSNILFISDNNSLLEHIINKPINFLNINTNKYENFYFLFLDIIQLFISHSNIDKHISTFNERYNILKHPHSNTALISPIDVQNKNKLKLTRSFLKNFIKYIKLKSIKLLLVFSIILSLYLLWAIFVPQYQQIPSMSNIKSNLDIPNESSLLIREDILNKIDQSFDNKSTLQTLVLTGIGGSGKTTLARQYAQQQKADIIWEINAETLTRVKESFVELAYALESTPEENEQLMNILKTSDAIKKENKIIKFVKEKMKFTNNWLLIYDNVENLADIQKYFPNNVANWGNGKVIITSRDSNIQNNNFIINHSIDVGELDNNQKYDFFLKVFRKNEKNVYNLVEENNIKEFLKKIPPFPLDITVAAYYLKTTHITLEQYLQNLAQTNSEFEKVQFSLLKDIGNYSDTRYNIIALSLRQIIEANEKFLNPLLFISMLDSQNIPRELLDRYSNNFITDDLVLHLKKYSLISSKSGHNSLPNTFTFHRSIQTLILTYLKKNYSMVKNGIASQCIGIFTKNYVEELIDNNNYIKINRILPHLEKIIDHKHMFSETINNGIKAALGCIYYEFGYDIKAINILKESIQLFRKSKKIDYEELSRALAYLGCAYRMQGKLGEAQTFFEESLDLYKKYNLNDKIAANSLTYLGNIYCDFGKYTESKEIFESALLIYKKYPQNKAGLAHALQKFGETYAMLGEYAKAQSLYEESYKVFEQFSMQGLGVARSLVYIGEIYNKYGNYSKAKELTEKALIIFREIYQESGLGLSWALLHLGDCYRQVGDYDKSVDLMEESLAISEKGEYKDSTNIFLCLIQLAEVYRDKGNYDKAEKLIENALANHAQYISKNFVIIADVINIQGEIQSLKGNYVQAEELFNKALDTLNQVDNHPNKFITLENLGNMYISKAKQEDSQKRNYRLYKNKANKYFNQALATIRYSFPENSPHIKRLKSKIELSN